MTGGDEVDIEIKISPDYKVPKVIILTEKVTDEINAIAARLSAESPQYICGFKDNMMHILEQSEIIRVYSVKGKVIAETKEEEFILRNRLYEMEEKLDSAQFVRISNSEIINLGNVKSFDMSLTGTICVRFKDVSSSAYVSRRYVSKIKKILGV